MVKCSSQAELMLASLACMFFFFLLRSKMIEYTLDTINSQSRLLECASLLPLDTYTHTQLAGPDRGSDACTSIAAVDPNERNLTQHTTSTSKYY